MVLRRVVIALLVSPVVWGGAAQASDAPVYAPAPQWVKPAPEIDTAALDDSAPIFLVMDQQQRLEPGKVTAYIETATRIASGQVLEQMGTLQLPWDPAKGDLIVHKVEILRGGEHIDLIAGGQRFQVLRREQGLEQAQLNGMLTATMPVQGLRVGDVLVLEFSITRADPALGGKVQTVVPLLYDPMRVRFGRVALSWPKAMDVRWRAYTSRTSFHEGVEGDYHVLNVTLPLPKPEDLPDDAPVRFQRPPILEATSFADWGDVARDMTPLYATEGAIAPGSALAGEVAKIVAASADPRTRAALALQLVQDKVRYLFNGMDNGNYVPQKPADTWQLRYGDCKAKTLLLLAMLRELGVSAEPALVNSSLGDLLPYRLAMPGAFDHVIVRAAIGGKLLWLDGTGKGARLIDLDDTPPFRNALPLAADSKALEAIPLRRDGPPDLDGELVLDQSAGINFPALFDMQVTVRGATAEMLRLVEAQASAEQRDKLVDSVIAPYLQDYGTPSAEMRSVSYDSAQGTAVVRAKGVVYPGWSNDGGRYELMLDRAVAGVEFSPDRTRPAWSDLPVATGNPVASDYRLRLHLPAGGAGFALDGDAELPAMLAGNRMARSAEIGDGWATMRERVTTGMAEVAPNDIPATREQVARAKAHRLKLTAPEGYPARFQQVEAAKRAKAFDPILAVYARVIAADPKEATGYTTRAWFLDSIYDRAGAIGDLDKAIALAPTADLYLWRARLHSALGDDAAALADVSAARKLDPGSIDGVTMLAQVARDRGDVSQVLPLVTERAASAGAGERKSYVSIEADLLSESGKVDEAIGALDQALARTPGDPTLLNSRCWLKGSRNVALDTALKDCTKSIELSDQPAHALDSRAMVYFRLDRLEDALADLNAALDIAPDLAASLYLRGVIRHRQGDKSGDADLAAARMIAPRIDETYGRLGIKP